MVLEHDQGHEWKSQNHRRRRRTSSFCTDSASTKKQAREEEMSVMAIIVATRVPQRTVGLYVINMTKHSMKKVKRTLGLIPSCDVRFTLDDGEPG